MNGGRNNYTESLRENALDIFEEFLSSNYYPISIPREIRCYVWSRRTDKSKFVSIPTPGPAQKVQNYLEPQEDGLGLGNSAKHISWVISSS